MNKPKSILLVEDDKDDQVFFAEALMEIENAILYGVANNGEEALDKLKNSLILPDLIFMDVNMPRMNGINCLTEILKIPRLKNIPVIFLTTDMGKKDILHKLGAKGFIEKPHDGKTLCNQLDKMINVNFNFDSYTPDIISRPYFQDFKLS